MSATKECFYVCVWYSGLITLDLGGGSVSFKMYYCVCEGVSSNLIFIDLDLLKTHF